MQAGGRIAPPYRRGGIDYCPRDGTRLADETSAFGDELMCWQCGYRWYPALARVLAEPEK